MEKIAIKQVLLGESTVENPTSLSITQLRVNKATRY